MKNRDEIKSRKEWLLADFSQHYAGGKRILLVMMLLILGTTGCVGTSHRNSHGSSGAEMLLPKLTSVVTGPAAILLTNGNAYGAKFTLLLNGDTEKPENVSGQILVQGTKLRFETAFNHATGQFRRAGDFGVVWDVASQQGFVFSEALQGYAPIHTTVQFTNQLPSVRTDQTNVTVIGSDGQPHRIELLRSQKMGDLPVRIGFLNGTQPFTLVFSEIKWIKAPEDLFLPPEDFTKYANEATLLTELEIRQHGHVREGHKPAEEDNNFDRTAPSNHRRSGSYQQP